MKNQKKSIIVSVYTVSSFLVLAFIGFITLDSCQNSTEQLYNDEIEYDESYFVADSIFSILTDYYNSNPDSAVIMALELEQEYIKTDNARDLLRLYSFLSELYQYRINDPNITLEYLTQALNVILENPDLQFDPTYLYINVGNIMFSYDLFDEAIYIYRQIPKISNAVENPKIMALINNNIGLSFQKKQQTDSARVYFKKSLEYIYDVTQGRNILLIQHNNYMSSLLYQIGDIDSLPYYYNRSIILFSSLDKALAKYPCTYVDQYKIDVHLEYCKNKMKSLDWMSKYYISKNNFIQAIYLLDDAVLSSKSTNNLMWTGDLFLSLSDAYAYNEVYDTAELYLDSAIIIFADFSSYDYLGNAYNKKSDINILTGNEDASELQLIIAEQYYDTIKTIETSDESILMKIQLAAKPVQLAMKNIEMSRNEKIRTINNQTLLIKLLVVALLLIIIVLFVYFSLYRNLKNTRFQLAHRTIEQFNEKNDNGAKKHQLKDSVEQVLLMKFESEVIDKKIYLESNLSLSIIAEKLDTNRSYISKLINTVYKMNYNDYINKLRIDEACNIICKNTNPNFTIDHLYSEVGFIGKSTFYTAFKKYAGVTPAVFFKINNQAKS